MNILQILSDVSFFKALCIDYTWRIKYQNQINEIAIKKRKF